jgi:DNA-binding response OmpR family regulator
MAQFLIADTWDRRLGTLVTESGPRSGIELHVTVSESAASEGNPPTVVLIVDDEPLIRWSLRKGLTNRGCQVAEAENGAEALAILAERPDGFDAVVLDYRLPDRQDLSLLRDVRALSPRSVVWLMTAFGDDDMRTEALALGAEAVIDKPFQVARFVQSIAATQRH